MLGRGPVVIGLSLTLIFRGILLAGIRIDRSLGRFIAVVWFDYDRAKVRCLAIYIYCACFPISAQQDVRSFPANIFPPDFYLGLQW
jgi:hypothetical protein